MRTIAFLIVFSIALAAWFASALWAEHKRAQIIQTAFRTLGVGQPDLLFSPCPTSRQNFIPFRSERKA